MFRYKIEYQLKKIRIKVIVFSILIIALPAACRTGAITAKTPPAEVSTRFFEALNNQKYDVARTLCTEGSIKVINVIENLSELGGGVNILRDNKKALIGCTEKSDTCICTYSAFSGPNEKVILIRQKGKWMVDLQPVRKP
jgi:hypothetical protein